MARTNTVRIGYARVSGRLQDHQLQLDALAEADCREIIVETASTRGDRPKLRKTLTKLKPGDTLVIHKPDRVARSMKELLVLLEDQLHAREVNLHILTGICAGLHKPNGQTMAEKMLFMVAAMAAEMERELIRERTLDGLAAAAAQGRKGGRPPAAAPDPLAVAIDRRKRGESVTAIAKHLKIGRSTLYRALEPHLTEAPTAERGHRHSAHWPGTTTRHSRFGPIPAGPVYRPSPTTTPDSPNQQPAAPSQTFRSADRQRYGHCPFRSYPGRLPSARSTSFPPLLACWGRVGQRSAVTASASRRARANSVGVSRTPLCPPGNSTSGRPNSDARVSAVR